MSKVFWAGYVTIEISKLAEELRHKKRWTKTKLIEEAFRALLEQEFDTLQSAGILTEESKYEKFFTKSGKPAIRLKEEVNL